MRQIGRLLGIPEVFVARQPFPGPGLAVRCLGEVVEPRLALLREADAIFREEIAAAGLYNQLWQAFCVLLPTRSVGVMGDVRTYAETAVLRAVESQDGMTADWARLPYDLLDRTARDFGKGKELLVLQIVKDLFVNHIKTSDKPLGSFLKELGVG